MMCIWLFVAKYAGAFHFVFLMQVLKRLVRATIKDVYEECLIAFFVWLHECALPGMRFVCANITCKPGGGMTQSY